MEDLVFAGFRVDGFRFKVAFPVVLARLGERDNA
jgi:hypothetical protein